MDQVNNQEGAVPSKSPKKTSKKNTVGLSDFWFSLSLLILKGRSVVVSRVGSLRL